MVKVYPEISPSHIFNVFFIFHLFSYFYGPGKEKHLRQQPQTSHTSCPQKVVVLKAFPTGKLWGNKVLSSNSEYQLELHKE